VSRGVLAHASPQVSRIPIFAVVEGHRVTVIGIPVDLDMGVPTIRTTFCFKVNVRKSGKLSGYGFPYASLCGLPI